jgi:fumarate reductase (CoM/CoB) subunit A
LSEPIDRFEVDILVVGGGLAGAQAAVSALEVGRSVAVATKRRFGRSGSSAMTSAGYAAVIPEWLDADQPALHYEDTLHGGGDIADPRLVRILCDEGPAMAKRLEALGGAFRKENGRYARSPSGDHSRPRTLGAEHRIGTDYTVPLAARAAELGARVLDSTMAVDLLLDERGAHGVVCLDVRDGRLLVVEAAATILATGGCGRLFPVTSNPPDVTGDGYALAARAGAVMRDMEFIQFYPWRCTDPFTSRVSFQPATWVAGGRLYNRLGERFMERYDPERLEATTRDVAARAIYDQVRVGLGVNGGVRVDVSALSEADMAETNPRILEGMRRKVLDYRTYPFVAAPEAHYFMGGALIDEDARTSIPGLYAVGEVAGGIQGANRISNNALPEALVFGHRAAVAAASAASTGPAAAPGTLVSERVERWRRGLERAYACPAGDAPRDLRGELEQRTLETLGIIRDEPALRAGLSYLDDLAGRLERSHPDAVGGLRDWVELGFMRETAELAATAALARTESRGAHYRQDHPERDDERWRGSVLVQRGEEGHLAWRVVPAPAPVSWEAARA